MVIVDFFILYIFIQFFSGELSLVEVINLIKLHVLNIIVKCIATADHYANE